MITLEISADELRYVVKVFKEKIEYLKLDNFENSSDEGLLEFQVINIGKIVAEYYVFYSCSEFILPLNSDKISLFSFQTQQIKKN